MLPFHRYEGWRRGRRRAGAGDRARPCRPLTPLRRSRQCDGRRAPPRVSGTGSRRPPADERHMTRRITRRALPPRGRRASKPLRTVRSQERPEKQTRRSQWNLKQHGSHPGNAGRRSEDANGTKGGTRNGNCCRQPDRMGRGSPQWDSRMIPTKDLLDHQ